MILGALPTVLAAISVDEIARLLWAIAGVIGVSALFVFVWRSGGLLRLKHGDSEVEIRQPLPVGEEPRRLPSEPEQPERAPTEEEPPVIEPHEVAEADNPVGQAHDMIRAGSFADGVALLREVTADETDPERRASTVAFGLYQTVRNGWDRGMHELRELADQSRSSNAYTWLGFALRDLGELAQAEAAFHQAFRTARTDADRRLTLTSLATVVRDQGRREEACDLLLEHAQTIERRLGAKLYAWVAKDLLAHTPPKTAEAFALFELAIEFAPLDRSLRFAAAYAYSEQSADGQAFVHYKELLRLDANHAVAANNLGVAASRLGLESEAVEAYRQAEALGNTLATANLSWKLIGAGFLTDAQQMLQAALGQDDVHENVLGALGRVAEAKSEEEEKQESLESRVEFVSGLRREIGRRAARIEPTPAVSLGRYSSGETHLELRTGPESDTIIGELQRPGIFAHVADLTGEVQQGALRFTWKGRRPAGGLLDWGASEGYGLLVTQADGSLHGFIADGQQTLDPWNAKGWGEWHFVSSNGA